MAYIIYKNLWESKFDKLVSKKDKVQDMSINQLKVEVHETYQKDEKLTTTFKPKDDSDVSSKSYLDEKLKQIGSHISCNEKEHNENIIHYNKQSLEDILIQRAVKTTIQRLYDKGLFDTYANADKILEVFLFVTRRRGDLEEENDVIHSFCS